MWLQCWHDLRVGLFGFFSDMILRREEASTWQNGSRSLTFSWFLSTDWNQLIVIPLVLHCAARNECQWDLVGFFLLNGQPAQCSSSCCHFYLITCTSKKLFLLFCHGRPPQCFNSTPPFKGGFGETSGPITAIWKPDLAWLYLLLSLLLPFFPNTLPCPAKPAITMSAWFDWQCPLSAPSSQCASTTVAPSISKASHGGILFFNFCLNIARWQTTCKISANF